MQFFNDRITAKLGPGASPDRVNAVHKFFFTPTSDKHLARRALYRHTASFNLFKK